MNFSCRVRPGNGMRAHTKALDQDLRRARAIIRKARSWMTLPCGSWLEPSAGLGPRLGVSAHGSPRPVFHRSVAAPQTVKCVSLSASQAKNILSPVYPGMGTLYCSNMRSLITVVQVAIQWPDDGDTGLCAVHSAFHLMMTCRLSVQHGAGVEADAETGGLSGRLWRIHLAHCQTDGGGAAGLLNMSHHSFHLLLLQSGI